MSNIISKKNDINRCCVFYCKNTNLININNENICYNHAKLKYNKYILIIQKYFIGYRCRKYLKKIFYKLPNDIQCIILDKINKSHYKNRYYKLINNIVMKKSLILHNYITYNYKIELSYITYCYDLYSKYFTLINVNYLKHFYILGKQILLISYKFVAPDIFFTEINHKMENTIIYENTSYSTIIKNIHSINNFLVLYASKIYNNKSNI